MAYHPAQIVLDVYAGLKQLINTLNRPLWVDPTTSRVKTDTVVSSGSMNIGTVTTVTTTTTVTNLGTANVSGIYIDRIAWADAIRPRIT